MTSYGYVELANLMKLVYYVTIVLVTRIMRDMMLHFIMHRLVDVVIVVMPMLGIQKGELLLFITLLVFFRVRD